MQATGATDADWVAAIGAVVAALGTVGALLLALKQIGDERAARHRSERVAQASRVSSWYASDDEHQTTVALLNESAEPVYGVFGFLVMIQGAGPTTGHEVLQVEGSFSSYWQAFGVLPPGRYYSAFWGSWRGMMRRAGSEIAFTDRNGVSWVRNASGALQELPVPPEVYYEIPQPIGWTSPSETPPSPPIDPSDST